MELLFFMKKYYWLLALITLVVVIVSVFLVRQWQGQTTLAEIKQRGVLRVGLDASFPPFEVVDESGQILGLDADIARAIAADLGVEVAFVNIGFDGLYDALKIKRVDILLSGLPIDSYMTEDVAYSTAYFNAGQVLVTRRSDIKTVADLEGQQVAVEWGSMGDMEGRRLQEIVPNLILNPQADVLTTMQFEIAIVDAVNAMTTPDLKRVVYLSDEWYAAAVRLEDSALLAAVNKTLGRLIDKTAPPCYLKVSPTEFEVLSGSEHCYK